MFRRAAIDNLGKRVKVSSPQRFEKGHCGEPFRIASGMRLFFQDIFMGSVHALGLGLKRRPDRHGTHPGTVHSWH
jgi:hypothetical protein